MAGVSAADASVADASAADANDLANTISSFSSDNATGSLSAAVSGNTVTVTGSLTNVYGTLELYIDEGVTVVWKATLHSGSDHKSVLIQLFGYGDFVVETGADIYVSNGIALTSSPPSFTISNIPICECTITMNGGTIRTDSGWGIDVGNFAENPGVLTINGGTISADTGRAVYGPYALAIASGGGLVAVDSKITINGGEIKATGDAGVALRGGSVTEIKGGVISATTGYAVKATTSNGNGSLIVSGGENVLNCSDTRYGGPTGNALIMAWNKSAGNMVYSKNTVLDIITDPAESTAFWNTIDGESGISYTYGTNSGFIALPVTVTADTQKPTVTSVTPSGADNGINGNIVIKFNEAITTTGAVSLNNNVPLVGGTWNTARTIYTIGYNNLSFDTQYTIKFPVLRIQKICK